MILIVVIIKQTLGLYINSVQFHEVLSGSRGDSVSFLFPPPPLLPTRGGHGPFPPKITLCSWKCSMKNTELTYCRRAGIWGEGTKFVLVLWVWELVQLSKAWDKGGQEEIVTSGQGGKGKCWWADHPCCNNAVLYLCKTLLQMITLQMRNLCSSLTLQLEKSWKKLNQVHRPKSEFASGWSVTIAETST